MSRPAGLPVVVALLLWACAPAPGPGPAPEPAAEPPPAPVYAAAHRPDVSGTEGAVVAGHPLAAAAGHEVLRAGGNAVDAAVTMAAVLAVVRPHMNGVGGDAFGLFYDAASAEVTALNGSGRAGRLASPGFFRERGHDRIPGAGGASVTVPGALSAWAAALERYGTLPLARALAPAIRYAEEGFPVSRTLRRDLPGVRNRLNPAGREIYFPGGELPALGARLANPALARTLRAIASEGPGALYGGAVGRALADFVEAEGGHLRPEDFADHTAEWTDPISVPDGRRTVHAFPPNTQGLVQLQQVAMAGHHPLRALGHNSPEYLHTLIELKKLAFADRDRWVADPDRAELPTAALLDPVYLQRRAALVGGSAAEEVAPGRGAAPGEAPGEGDGDTVYLMAVDRWGNAVSWIQSLFSSMGSGLVEPSTGIVLQNRGAGFTLDAEHPNVIAPEKRPFHTLNPVMVTGADGRPLALVGTPGGHGQSQFVLQVYHNLFHFGMSPQEAVEAPRFRAEGGVRVLVEDRLPPATRAGLAARGHDLGTRSGFTATFGGVQVILVDGEHGTLLTGADPRREAYGIAY